MGKEKKLEAYNLGLLAEEKASEEYLKKGFAIRERRWKLGKTEIDLIAQKDNLVVLIEVKARNGRNEDAISTVTKDKRKRMIRAADSYLKQLQGAWEYRFDIVAFTGDKENYELAIFEDAFVAADLF